MLPRKFVRVVRVVYSTLSRNGSQRRVPETVLQARVPRPRAEPASAVRNMVGGSEAKEPRGHLVNLLHHQRGRRGPSGERQVSPRCIQHFPGYLSLVSSHSMTLGSTPVRSVSCVRAKKSPHKRASTHGSRPQPLFSGCNHDPYSGRRIFRSTAGY